MKKLNFLFLFMFLCFGVISSSAQVDVENTPEIDGYEREERPPGRLNLLRELGLNQEQIQQIRQINRDARPLRQAAAERFQSAKQTLDLSIHADDYDEAKIQSNLREVIDAQGELFKLKIQSELAVRKVLSPEQLVKFREIRNNFDERNNSRKKMRRNRNSNRPNRRRRNP